MRVQGRILLSILTVGMAWLVGCKDDSSHGPPPLPPANTFGSAVVDVKLLETPLGGGGTPPLNQFPGYKPLNMDLNEGTGGSYVWLYYKMGRADGSDGTPLGEVYTVDETEGEKLKAGEDTKLALNLTSGSPVSGAHKIFLAFKSSSWPVVRGIAVADIDFLEATPVIKYAPPDVKDKYPVVWVKEQVNKEPSASPEGPWGNGAQDLNEGTSFLPFMVSDWIYIGYCVDQEVYDWLQAQ